MTDLHEGNHLSAQTVARPSPTSDSSSSAPLLDLPSRPDSRTTFRRKIRRPSEDLRGRLSAVALHARERTTGVFRDLSLRDRSSQTSLRSRSRADSQRSRQVSASTSSHSTHRRGSYNNSSHSSQESYTTAASSISGEIAAAANNEGSLARPSVDRKGPDRTRFSDSSSPPLTSPALAEENADRMHQTSSRLLRMTNDERPFTKDFKDLFATLMVSLPLTAHRVRFQRIEHTFTSEEAINNLGSLKFAQSNRMPDPKDPARIVTTTTTTTFSMAKEMARSVCQRFMEARFIEPADGKPTVTFALKGAVWQLTPKGIMILGRFCQRNGIQQRHVLDVIESPRNSMTMVILERESASDRISQDRGMVEVLFRRFAGQSGPNIRSVQVTAGDSEFVNEEYNGLVGVRLAKDRRVGDKIVHNTFTGKGATDWLMDCTTSIDRRETYEMAELFVTHQLMEAVVEDRAFVMQNPGATKFQPTRSALYRFTDKGQRTAGWLGRETALAGAAGSASDGYVDGRTGTHNTNNNRLLSIVNDSALRLLFREYLIGTHCEENLSFFLEVREFTDSYDNADRAKAFTKNEAIRESLAAAYGLYNAFLAPGSPCELNIDHNLRNSLSGRMTRAVSDDQSMYKSLQEVVALFKEAQSSVFKLMSSDSVPKFLKEPRYNRVLREHNVDAQARSGSPSEASQARTSSQAQR